METEIAVDVEGDPRVGLCEARQDVRQINRGEILRGAETDGAFDVGFEQACAGLIGKLKQLPRISQQYLSIRRKLQISAAAFEQSGLQVFFQLLDLETDRGLASTNTLPGLGEAAIVHHRREGSQEVEIERRA
jgi:hypothetical protein